MAMNRTERVLQKMKEHDLTQLIVSDPYSILYLTGCFTEPMERMWVLLLKDNGEKYLFANRLFNVPELDIPVIWFSDTDDYVGMLARHIDSSRTLGVDKVFPARFLIPLMNSTGVKTVLGSQCVDDVRAVKDKEEQKLMFESSAVNDKVMEDASRYIKVGMSERQIAEFIASRYLAYGCQGNSFDSIVSFEANAADPHHEPDNTVLQKGQLVLIDIGGRLNGYCSDMTRTFFTDQPDEKHLMIYELVRKANEKAISIIKPGVRLKEIDAAARDLITEAGYGPYFNHRLGHFIGQTDHEQGDVSSANENPVEPGMIFSIEPGIYLPGEFGVRIEDLVMVTEDGCRLLNHVDKNWKIIG
ncbi:MAG: aminopeptidase P family protein [Erysipelotrichaceae bacterium]|nr:aminopeptidase P family protein [Erysipelotrichaceae bacterium]